jgi:hypothetical protein
MLIPPSTIDPLATSQERTNYYALDIVTRELYRYCKFMPGDIRQINFENQCKGSPIRWLTWQELGPELRTQARRLWAIPKPAPRKPRQLTSRAFVNPKYED